MNLGSLKLCEIANRRRKQDQDSSTIKLRSASSEGIKALVMTCIDFRLVDSAITYLNNNGYLTNFDDFILAGASLGYNTSLNRVNPQYSGWDKVFENHIDISYNLHKIKEIICIDHMDCGAFKAQLNDGKAFTKYDELKKHIENLNTFRMTINSKYINDDKPKYSVKLWLMRLDGTVDTTPTFWQPNTTTFNLSKNNMIVIGAHAPPPSFTIVGSIDEPLSTIIEKKYHLLNNKKDKITSSSIITLRSVNQNGNEIWFIKLLQNVTTFLSKKTSRTKSYYVNLTDSSGCVKVTLFACKNDFRIKCTIESVDYF
jgi:hypothetical protein